MSTMKAGTEVWQPHTEADRQVVVRELQNLLESSHFCNSKRYPKFLSYVVQCTLDGNAHLLKERTIGVEVFARPLDYDTNADTVVRFTAGEVRKRLALYYHEREGQPPVQISLPIGSYVPEFLHRDTEGRAHSGPELPVTSDAQVAAIERHLGPEFIAPPMRLQKEAVHFPARRLWLVLLAVGVIVAAILYGVLSGGSSDQSTEVDRYWAPLLAGKNPILVASGGSVLDPDRSPGPTTADRTTDYPFVSMQMVTAIVRVTGIFERRGIPYEIRSAPFLTLTDLRERPTVLVGGYNNQWTMRLASSLRFYFKPGSTEAILDHQHPEIAWQRDPALPYSSADDYALISRFRDPTTDSMIYIVAGIGRNGTEAAAQFVTNPRFLELLKQQVGPDWMRKNVEAVIKTHVIDGRTGAPSIVAVHSW